MTGHKVYVCNKLLAHFPKGVKYRYFKAGSMYDPAMDGPEVELIQAFRVCPEGSDGEPFWRFVRDSHS